MPGPFQYPQAGDDQRDLCVPRFYLRPTIDQDATDKAGYPVFKDEEFVEVIIPKSKDFRPVYKVNDQHRKRWPQQYDNFKKSMTELPDGFRLDEWSMMPRSIAETLKSLQIYTMEQFVLIPEDDLKILGPGIGDLQKHAAEVIATRDEKQEQIDELSSQNAELMQRLERLEAQIDNPLDRVPAQRRRAKSKPKKQLSQAQIDALKRAREKRAEQRAAIASERREDNIPRAAPLKG